MNKTKTIYFLSAVVLIIGCYALNLSYSLFVQTEEKEIVNSSVPSLIYNLEQDTFLLQPNEKKIITLKINNSGNSNINYGITLDEPISNENINIQLVDIENNDITGSLDSNSTKTIKLYIENANEIEQSLKFKVEATYGTLNFDTTKYTTNTNIDIENKYKLNLNDNILLDNRIIKNNEDIVISGLYKTVDDYGETWYFKGLQDYNYVAFANMIWRVVRINGDNTIRLILNTPLEDRTVFNEINSNDLGYMYGSITDDAGLTQYNKESSVVKRIVDKFYEVNLKENFEVYLADSLFCGEKIDLTNINDLNLKCDEEIIENNNRYTSNLDETNSINNISINNNLTYPIALLSAKEIISAEIKNQDESISNYLYDLEQDSNWWSMSPTNTNTFVIANNNTKTVDTLAYNEEGYVRPVINLKSNILIKSGNGTFDSPYEIMLPEELSETLD